LISIVFLRKEKDKKGVSKKKEPKKKYFPKEQKNKRTHILLNPFKPLKLTALERTAINDSRSPPTITDF